MSDEAAAEPVSGEVLASVAEFLGIDAARVGRKSPSFAANPAACANCGKKLDFYDFVTTAADSGEHSKDFMIRFLDSNLSMGRTLPVALTCSACNGKNQVTVSYYYSPGVCGQQI
jgi:hypothetical protein